MRSRSFVGLTTALSCLSACGDLQIRSIPPTEVVPASIEGEWQGAWQSQETGSSGLLSVRIQEFDLQPLVALTIDNPCLIPRDYELVLLEGRFALEADGQPVLEANLVGTQLSGTYRCLADSGSWQATRLRDLPELLDLTGTWTGSVSLGALQEPLVLDLVQVVRNGALALEGFAQLPGALPVPLAVTGYVQFRDDDFDLFLQTDGGVEPILILTGVGDRDPLQVPLGLLQVLGAQTLPFAQGVFEVVRQVE